MGAAKKRKAQRRKMHKKARHQKPYPADQWRTRTVEADNEEIRATNEANKNNHYLLDRAEKEVSVFGQNEDELWAFRRKSRPPPKKARTSC